MSVQSQHQQLADLRHYAHRLVEQTGEHERQLKALVASAEWDVRQAEASLYARDTDVTQVQNLLSAHMHRSTVDAATARRLCVSAHQQHAAARQLLTRLSDDHGAGEEYPNAVLVVDDCGDIREILAHVLRDAGFVVRTAANGLEALIAAFEMRPGVIVMDVSMPVLDGIEATRLIKATETTRDARVIAYTGNPTFDDGLTQTFFAAVLRKPATPDVVLATVQHVAGL